VRKRDGSEEPFDPGKLAGAFWRVMAERGGCHELAGRLAGAVETYLICRQRRGVSTAALFEMAVKVLRGMAMPGACEALERHWAWRATRRRRLLLDHGHGRVTLWDKTWLAELGRRSWRLSRNAARIVAGQIEVELLGDGRRSVSREEVVDRLNRCVAQFGLADAVPVAPPVRA